MHRSRPFRRAPLVAAVAVLCALPGAGAEPQRSEPRGATRAADRDAAGLRAGARSPQAVRGSPRTAGSAMGPRPRAVRAAPDLTRSELVAADERGDRIGRSSGRGAPRPACPRSPRSPNPTSPRIVAFIHDQKTKAEAETGGRRSVEVADLQTGNARAGRRYFESACSGCHSASGDFAGLASRLRRARVAAAHAVSAVSPACRRADRPPRSRRATARRSRAKSPSATSSRSP